MKIECTVEELKELLDNKIDATAEELSPHTFPLIKH